MITLIWLIIHKYLFCNKTNGNGIHLINYDYNTIFIMHIILMNVIKYKVNFLVLITNTKKKKIITKHIRFIVYVLKRVNYKNF